MSCISNVAPVFIDVMFLLNHWFSRDSPRLKKLRFFILLRYVLYFRFLQRPKKIWSHLHSLAQLVPVSVGSVSCQRTIQHMGVQSRKHTSNLISKLLIFILSFWHLEINHLSGFKCKQLSQENLSKNSRRLICSEHRAMQLLSGY